MSRPRTPLEKFPEPELGTVEVPDREDFHQGIPETMGLNSLKAELWGS